MTKLSMLGVLVVASGCSSKTTDSAVPDAGDSRVDPSTLPCDGVFVGHVTGNVFDVQGNPPAPPAAPTICGSACVAGKLAPDGTFSVTPKYCYKSSDIYYPTPVVIFHGVPDYANVVVDFVPVGTRHIDELALTTPIITMKMVGLPRVKVDKTQPIALDDGQGFSLSAQAGSIEMPLTTDSIVVGPADLSRFPLGPGKGGETLTALYALMPDETAVTPPATVRFPNTKKLTAGAAVELVAIGNLVTTKLFKPGTLGIIGSGRVTGDGAYVESVPGTDTGLITLGWIGYRPKG